MVTLRHSRRAPSDGEQALPAAVRIETPEAPRAPQLWQRSVIVLARHTTQPLSANWATQGLAIRGNLRHGNKP